MKAIVPSPILKSCLDDMVDAYRGNPFADDSDDDDEGKSAKKVSKKASTGSSDEFTGSLRVKEGRNANNILYYVDHTKLQNSGNGLLPEDKNELYANLEKSKMEKEAHIQNLKQIASETAQLLSEPKNEELALELEEIEKQLQEINNQLEASRVFASNEKYAKQLNKRIENMASFWRKRKRTCMEFIMCMEEATDGTISVKKCVKGEGQIEIESDEMCLKGSEAYAKKKRPRVVSKGGLKRGGGENGGLLPDERLIGVKLDSQGKPVRVYLDAE